jgi:hypothetical protein
MRELIESAKAVLTGTVINEAAPFASLGKRWLATKGDKQKQAKLIKKHDLKPIISKVRPGEIKLGVLNSLKAKGIKAATFAGLDADSELIFVSNNPTKVYYAKNTNRPDGIEIKEECDIVESEYKGKKVKLNDPWRGSDGKKKFYVYVKNEKGNTIKLGFGDPNSEIKRDDPGRLKNFRARHQCDTDLGPKWKARYWSCKFWEKGKTVTDLLK